MVAGALVSQARWDVMGLAAAFSVGSVLQASGLAWMLRRRICIPWRALLKRASRPFAYAARPSSPPDILFASSWGRSFRSRRSGRCWRRYCRGRRRDGWIPAFAAWVFRIPEFFQVKEALVAKLLRRKPEIASMEEVHDLG